MQSTITLAPGSRMFLVDLDTVRGREPRVLASACKAVPSKQSAHSLALTVEGVAETPAIVLLRAPKAPSAVTLAGQPLQDYVYSHEQGLLWIRFTNEARPRVLALDF